MMTVLATFANILHKTLETSEIRYNNNPIKITSMILAKVIVRPIDVIAMMNSIYISSQVNQKAPVYDPNLF
jgi:hypothetical protein